MLQINEKKECCGCSACQQICPKECITMNEDTEGFYYPVVDEKKCVNCNLCEKVCPIKKEEKRDQKLWAYATYSKETKIRLQSSSGGMFSLIAEYVLKNKGIVFGVVFNSEQTVNHVSIERLEDLDKLRGSKYIQSQIKETYKEAKSYLEKGKLVLFTGTACQIAGLKGFLRKEYENLVTIDVLCHGVPSKRVWKKYIENQENLNNGHLKNVFFRNKDNGWKQYEVCADFDNGREYRKMHGQDIFMRLFLSEICLRPSCHDCHFKSLDRPSDFTLGDSWGIENYMPEMDDDKGTSVVLLHSEKAKEIFEKLKDKMIFKEAEVDKILPPTADSRKSVIAHPKRKQFFELLEQGVGIEKLVKLIEPSVGQKIKNKVRNGLRKCKRLVTEIFKVPEIL